MKDKIINNFTKIAYMKKLKYVLIISILIVSCDDKNCYIQNVYVNEFNPIAQNNAVSQISYELMNQLIDELIMKVRN